MAQRSFLMKNYRNPQLPEGINTTPGHPLWTFIKLFSAIAIVLVIAAWFLGKSGAWLASLIPYSQEVAISKTYAEEVKNKDHPEMQAYLQSLADRLTPNMDLPEGMQIYVHYESENVENAFATLGGHIFLYRGLLEKLDSENSLAMLVAHEMAHVKQRHPIKAAGQNVAISQGMKYLLGYSHINLLGKAGLYTQLHFSRSMESEADEYGLGALYKTYGTAAGAIDLFETLHQVSLASGNDSKTPFFSTHPLDEQRIQHLQEFAQEKGWLGEQELIPLPSGFKDWL